MNETVFELIKKNITDPAILEVIQKSFLKRARATAIVLGSAIVITLIAIVYAYVQQVSGEMAKQDIKFLKEEIELQKAETEKQVGLALEAKIIAEEAAKLSYEELEKCRAQK